MHSGRIRQAFGSIAPANDVIFLNLEGMEMPGFTATDLNGHNGPRSVKLATPGPPSQTDRFFIDGHSNRRGRYS